MKRLICVVIVLVAFGVCVTDVKIEFIRSVSNYSDYSTVDWEYLNDKY